MSDPSAPTSPPDLVLSEAEWRARLSPEAFRILRQAGTERAFTGRFWNHFEPGRYRCAGCRAELFAAEAKFESGCGWPSFSAAVAAGRTVNRLDVSHGMRRVEVLCAGCHGHLGHVFDDGPPPSRQRYCINSECLIFEADAP